jgi:hypothetical protein
MIILHIFGSEKKDIIRRYATDLDYDTIVVLLELGSKGLGVSSWYQLQI